MLYLPLNHHLFAFVIYITNANKKQYKKQRRTLALYIKIIESYIFFYPFTY